MDVQLVQVQRELHEATARVRQLVEPLPDAAWRRWPDMGGWSVGHCIMHLNKSTEGFLPRLDAAIREGRQKNLTGTGPFRGDAAGWLLCRFVEPPYRIKIKTPAPFDPQDVDSADKVMMHWERLQNELCLRIAAADGLALDKVKVVSPFAGSLKYNLLAAFMVIPAHQRRHAWQAERIIKSFT
jgi:hypothetical protein